MPTFKWSRNSRWWSPLCTNTLQAETSVPNSNGNCEICVVPLLLGTGTTGTGTATGTSIVPEPVPNPEPL